MKKAVIILTLCIMASITSFAQISKNPVLIEEWTITVSEPHLRSYYEIFEFYDNGQFIFKRKDYSNIPDVSTTGTYYYQPKTDKFFLTFSDTTHYSNFCIQAVKGTSMQPDAVGVMYYYDWGIDTSGNYYTNNDQEARTQLFKTLVRKKTYQK